MNNKTFFSVAAALFLCVTGCHGADRAPASGSPPAAAASPAAVSPSADRSLVVTVDVGITVANVDASVAALRDQAEHAGGFVADQSTHTKDDDKTARLELRVPADKVRALRASFRELGDVTMDNEKVEDVTEQRADTEARLRNAHVQEKRILELLGQKASSLNEILEAEKELARVRETIERLETQDRALESKIAMATVRVHLTTHAASAWQTPGASVGRAGKAGLRGAASIAVYGAMGLAAVGPTLLPIAALVVAIAFAVRRRRALMIPDTTVDRL